MAWIRCSSRVRFLGVSSCSQIRRTSHPALRSARFTKRSRALFAESLFRQKAALFFGWVECSGQPCQKQPSTNTANLRPRNTKSGLVWNLRRPPCWVAGPNEVIGELWALSLRSRTLGESDTCLRQPVMRWVRKNLIRASSVSLFPVPRMRDITCERLALVKTSGMFRLWRLENQSCDAERARRNGDIPRVHPFVPGANLDEVSPRQLVDGFERPILGEQYDQNILE